MKIPKILSINIYIEELIQETYNNAYNIILDSKDIINECSKSLLKSQLLTPENIDIIMKKYNIDINI